MSETTCGCTPQPCGCCEGVEQLTPVEICNRPGLRTLAYRVGTQAAFFETMKARLSTVSVDGVGPDGQTVQTFRPMQGLTARTTDDFSIALLDGWATVGDVLTFYQERIANEGFLGTAAERRSVLELSRLVGYTPRPGVAASVFLAYTVDDNQADPVTIGAGTAAQSIPGPGETPQTFETSEDLEARREWNNLQVRLAQPQDTLLDNALAIDTIHVAGVNTKLKEGDKLLLLYADDGSIAVLRTVASIDTRFDDQHSAIALQQTEPKLLASAKLLQVFAAAMRILLPGDSTGEAQKAFVAAIEILKTVYLGASSTPRNWATEILRRTTDGLTGTTTVDEAIESLKQKIADLYTQPNTVTRPTTSPEAFVGELLVKPVPQVRNSLDLPRSLIQTFVPQLAALQADATDAARASTAQAPAGGELRSVAGVSAPVKAAAAHLYSDAGTQLLLNLDARLKPTYYAAWRGASLSALQPALKGVYALRSRNTLFGATAPKPPTFYYYTDSNSGHQPGALKPSSEWAGDWAYATDETDNNAFLDQANDSVAVGSYALIASPSGRRVLRVGAASTAPRSEYGVGGQSTRLTFDAPNGGDWRTVDSTSGPVMSTGSNDELRNTQLYVQSEPLTLVDLPITADVGAREITLDGLYQELKSGRWVILSGERADITAVGGVKVSELMMISGLRHATDPALPGDTVHTTLQLATPPAYTYKRSTLKIYGNVVKATHGETREEVLGNGDGAQALQSFTLKQPPLTFVSAPTVKGADSTLKVFVNQVRWHETSSLAWLGPKDRGYTILIDDDAKTTVIFGNGKHGTRLPSGVRNVTAVYRSGIGRPGNVRAEQISLLKTRPLGVKAVINPLRASGGADKETRDLARENAPLSVMPLDRLVSVPDYADFTRGFAGVAKALARRTTDGQREIVYLTIAGVDDAPIDTSSDLYQNLSVALIRLGDPDLPLRIDVRELVMLVLSAKIKLQPDYQWEPVATAVRTRLLDRFGFARRALGQPALRSELISLIQSVRGVDYVDVDAFGGVPEKRTGTDGTRRLLTQTDIARSVAQITGALDAGGGAPSAASFHLAQSRLDGVDVFPGGFDQGLLRPAQLAMFTPSVPDTLILNQIP